MANHAGHPVKSVSEPGVVADFNVRNHCTNHLEPAVFRDAICPVFTRNPVFSLAEKLSEFFVC
jgi:hypothetical protein